MTQHSRYPIGDQKPVQGASRGHFVLGDNLYGEVRLKGVPRLCLHCRCMTIQHPLQKETVSVCAPVPDELDSFLSEQRKVVGNAAGAHLRKAPQVDADTA